MFGIIVDTFGELRNEANDRSVNLEGACFVCDTTRGYFETRSLSFGEHVEDEHDMMGYIHYLAYIMDKGEW